MNARRTANGRAWLRPVEAEPRPATPEAPTRRTPSDAEIIEAVRSGDEAVAGALYDRLLPVVSRTILRVFGRREVDHDDLVQASFEQIVRTLVEKKFAGACSLATWASTVATHVALNGLRSRRRERRVIDRDADEGVIELRRAEHSGPEHQTAVTRSLERVRGHLAALTPEKAHTLFLHDVLGHELAEIAVLTGVSVAAAQSRLVRGRKELYERLARDTRGEEGRR